MILTIKNNNKNKLKAFSLLSLFILLTLSIPVNAGRGNGNGGGGHGNGNSNGGNGNGGGGGNSSSHKIDICHVPPGNPNNGHTINIDVNGLHGHRHHANDYLGECQSNNTTSTNEDLYVIYNCANNPNLPNGEYRVDFLETVHAFNSPVIIGSPVIANSLAPNSSNLLVSDVTWNDTTAAILSALSDCKDSAKGNAQINSTSDGNHLIVQGCKNVAVNVAESYRTALQDEAESMNFSSVYTIVPELALSDTHVKEKYQECLDDGGSIIESHQSSRGYNYVILNNCSNTTALNDALNTFQESVQNNSSYPIFITASDLADYDIQTKFDVCCDSSKGGATCTLIPQNGGFSGRLNWREVIEP